MSETRTLIFFPEGNLPYSPSTINLHSHLSQAGFVAVLANGTGRGLTIANLFFLPNKSSLVDKCWFAVLKALAILRFPNFYGDIYPQALAYVRALREVIVREKITDVVAVDIFATALAQHVNLARVHFMSFEISSKRYLEKVALSRLSSIIIQRLDRYDYLFSTRHQKIFIIQNAPVFKTIAKPATEKKKIIFAGFASKGFGVLTALEIINQSSNYVLTIKGSVERDVEALIARDFQLQMTGGRLIIDREYTNENDMAAYLGKFRIGICFYDTSYPHINNFNYLTAPSGKLFKYLAAGVPVVANNIPGLSILREFKCGVLVDDLNPIEIIKAFETIELDYDVYVNNAFRAAEYYSFDKAVAPFVNFLSDKA